MVTITCQYTGIQFTAQTRRSKNHPFVAAWLSEAQSRGVYGQLIDALRAARENGATDIEQFRAAWREVQDADIARKGAALAAEREREQAALERKRARDVQNAHLRAHGYTWHLVSDDDIEDGMGYEPAGWQLHAPDDALVTVAQALDEIERGREVVRGEIAERDALAREKAARVDALRAERDAIADDIRARGERPEYKEYPLGERILDTSNIMGSGSKFIVNADEVWFCEIHGMDGDNWAANNIANHARGWRIPFDAHIADRLRAIRDELVSLGAHRVLSMDGGSYASKE